MLNVEICEIVFWKSENFTLTINISSGDKIENSKNKMKTILTSRKTVPGRKGKFGHRSIFYI